MNSGDHSTPSPSLPDAPVARDGSTITMKGGTGFGEGELLDGKLFMTFIVGFSRNRTGGNRIEYLFSGDSTEAPEFIEPVIPSAQSLRPYNSTTWP